jgi:subtilisin family serine protease
MRFIASIIFAILTLSFAAAASGEELSKKFSTSYLFSDKKQYNSRELIVKFKPAITADEKNKLISSLKVKEISSIDKGDISLLTVSKASDLKPLTNELLTRKEIVFAEPNYKIETAYVPEDPGYVRQWYLQKIGMPSAWNSTKGNSAITVAVIDSGVQINHPELAGKIISPINMLNGSTETLADEHGTHVAGIIAASLNKSGVAGIAPNVKIMPVNVFSGDSASIYNIIRGIYYATDHKANIINLSLGGTSYSQALEGSVNYARSNGVLVVAAAGNDSTNTTTYPAAFPGVVGVSATNGRDEITSFSNYGHYIDIAAPGEMIFSTVTGSSYNYMSGTSMAAPVVSGVSALLLSKNPFLAPEEVENILKRSALDLGHIGRDDYFGYGRINASLALENTPEPYSRISASTKKFKIEGTNKLKLSLDVYKGTQLTAYVKNSNGTIIQYLSKKNDWPGGKLTLYWNGKQKDGKYVKSGTYKVVIKITNEKETVYRSVYITVENAVIPTITVDKASAFSPAKQSKLPVSYYVNKNSKITAAIFDSRNKKVKQLSANKLVTDGKKTLYWDGKNGAGKKVKDGKYKLLIYAVDSQKRKSSTKRMDIIVDSVKPSGAVASPTAVYKMDGKSKASVKMKVKERVTVNVYILTQKGKTIDKIVSSKSYKSGTYTLRWDGKNSKNKYVPAGKYKFKLEVIDRAGNVHKVQSKVFSLQDWRLPSVYGKAVLKYRMPETASYTYTINKPGNVKLELFQNGKKVRTLYSSKWKKSGTHTFKWNGKNSSGQYLETGKVVYQLTLTDIYKKRATYTGTINVVK